MNVCRRCLGRRLVGAQGLEAQEAAAPEGVPEPDCEICEGAFADAPTWTQLALDALQPYEFATFQVGTVFPASLEGREKELRASHDNEIGDSVRTEANRLLAAAIAEATGTTTAPDGRPEVVVQVDTRFWHAEATANSLFVRGRYTKLRRDIPQTHWPCKTCQGTGCYACDDSGVMYPESVEDAIGVVIAAAVGSSQYKFHGAGREDIDALMLGTGRPFVVEVLDPVRRQANWTAVESAIALAKGDTGVGATDLRVVGKEDVAEIKGADYQKTYVAHCECQGEVTRADVEAACAKMTGVTLDQQTPDRVAHRRADLVRNRTVYELSLEKFEDGRHFSIAVRAESGTYIKEMVSSDEGRTKPSFSEVLGMPTYVALLDVVGILDDN